jgi:UDP-N-acetyl-alpha-D-quinovosamine dehydrogenase
MTNPVRQPRILVTGSTGFIGRRLIRRLLADAGPDPIVCLVKAAVTPLEARALDEYRAMGLRLIEGSLVDGPVSSEAPPAVDLVFHLAANIDTDATDHDARVNDAGTRNLLEWLQPVSHGARIVYTSSVAVHDRDAHPVAAISEESPFVPRTAYGRTKLKGEQIIRERSGPDGYSWTILRLPTVYGPGQKPAGLFDKMIRMASSGALLGRVDWPGRTSIVHVDDAADVMVDLAMREEAADQVYCVASDESLTVGELARKIGEVIGRPVTPIRLPRPLVKAAEAVVWNRAVQAAVPRFARVPVWRLSLIISDGFWFNTTKFRRVYRKPLRNVEEGLREIL